MEAVSQAKTYGGQFMMKSLVFALLCASATGFAAPITMKVVSLTSGMVNGVIKLRIAPLADGQFAVQYDPNSCGDPGPCTEMAASSFTVRPTVVSDSRNVDGPLVLKLNEQLQLIVSSGETRDGLTHISAKINGTTIPLTADVSVEVGQ
jgi:hypothetical protein